MYFSNIHPSWRKVFFNLQEEATHNFEVAYSESCQPIDRGTISKPFLKNLENIRVIVLLDQPNYLPEMSSGNPLSVGDTTYKTLLTQYISFLKVSGEISEPLEKEFEAFLIKLGITSFYVSPTTSTMGEDSHQKLWKPFTEKLLKNISTQKTPIIWLLWGKYASTYKRYIYNPIDIDKYDSTSLKNIPADYARNYIISSSEPEEDGRNHIEIIANILKKFKIKKFY